MGWFCSWMVLRSSQCVGVAARRYSVDSMAGRNRRARRRCAARKRHLCAKHGAIRDRVLWFQCSLERIIAHDWSRSSAEYAFDGRLRCGPEIQWDVCPRTSYRCCICRRMYRRSPSIVSHVTSRIGQGFATVWRKESFLCLPGSCG